MSLPPTHHKWCPVRTYVWHVPTRWVRCCTPGAVAVPIVASGDQKSPHIVRVCENGRQAWWSCAADATCGHDWRANPHWATASESHTPVTCPAVECRLELVRHRSDWTSLCWESDPARGCKYRHIQPPDRQSPGTPAPAAGPWKDSHSQSVAMALDQKRPLPAAGHDVDVCQMRTNWILAVPAGCQRRWWRTELSIATWCGHTTRLSADENLLERFASNSKLKCIWLSLIAEYKSSSSWGWEVTLLLSINIIINAGIIIIIIIIITIVCGACPNLATDAMLDPKIALWKFCGSLWRHVRMAHALRRCTACSGVYNPLLLRLLLLLTHSAGIHCTKKEGSQLTWLTTGIGRGLIYVLMI